MVAIIESCANEKKGSLNRNLVAGRNRKQYLNSVMTVNLKVNSAT